VSTAQKVVTHLEARFGNNIKKRGNTYRCPSPLRPDSDGQSFSLTINDDEHGFYKDFVNEESGSLYTLADKLGIEKGGNNRPNSHRNAPEAKNLDEYAKAHGVSPQVFLDAMWKDTTRYGKPAIQFQTKSGARWRMLAGKQKFANSNGYQACWYGLNDALRKMIDQYDKPTLVYTNGEASVVVAQHFGIPAITIAGGGERAIPDTLMNQLEAWLEQSPAALDKLQIIVALDCDKKGYQAAQTLVDQLQKRGKYPVQAIDLNLGDKGDLADFCRLHRGDAMSALHDTPSLDMVAIEERQREYRRWRRGTLQDILETPNVEWLLEPFIPKRQVGVLFGQSNIGKSFCVLDMGLVASQNYRVEYMIAESLEGYRQRILAWGEHHKKPVDKMTYTMGGVRLLDDEEFHNYIDDLSKEKLDLLIIDTAKKTMVGHDMNSGRDVSLYLDRCEEIRNRLGCAVLLVSHTNKGGQTFTGSYNWYSETEFVIKAYEQDGLIALESSKEKNSEKNKVYLKKLHPVSVAYKGEVLESVVPVDAELVRQTITDALFPNQQKVLEILALSLYDTGARRADISSDMSDVPYRTLTGVLSRLKDLRFIDQPSYGKYKITDLGRQKIGLEPRGDDAHDDDDNDNEHHQHPPIYPK